MGITSDLLIVRYSEIFLKSGYVKRRFKDILISNIINKFNNLGVRFNEIKLDNNLICIYGNFSDETVNSIANTFGVNSVSPAISSKSSISAIKECFNKVNLIGEDFPKTFCVRSKKDKNLKASHKTIEIEIASFFKGIRVDLEKPEVVINTHSTPNQTLIYLKRIMGPSGIPYGSQGKIVSLLSNGIDSPVAAWLMGKRGCEIIALHFGDQDINDVVSILEEYSGRKIKIINVSQFNNFLMGLKEANSGKYQCILCKSAMYRIANLVAKNHNAKAILTGENLGQVASQTLDNLSILDKSSEMPVLRPLIGLNKDEIVEIARKIGSLSLQINKRCEYVPEKPATQISFNQYKELLEKVKFEDKIEQLWYRIED